MGWLNEDLWKKGVTLNLFERGQKFPSPQGGQGGQARTEKSQSVKNRERKQNGCCPKERLGFRRKEINGGKQKVCRKKPSCLLGLCQKKPGKKKMTQGPLRNSGARFPEKGSRQRDFGKISDVYGGVPGSKNKEVSESIGQWGSVQVEIMPA